MYTCFVYLSQHKKCAKYLNAIGIGRSGKRRIFRTDCTRFGADRACEASQAAAHAARHRLSCGMRQLGLRCDKVTS